MRFKDYPVHKLPFSSLFQTFVTDYNQLSDFYETNPFDLQAVKNEAEELKFKGKREETADFLLRFNRKFDVDEEALKNIKRVKEEGAVALVTGQQLGLFGGPVYTFYKIISVIHLSRKLEKQLERPVIPVFWPADEDHDFDEVRTVNVLNSEGLKTFSLPKDQSNQSVAEIEFPEELNALKANLREALIDTDFTGDLGELVNSCFTPKATFLEGFGKFISRIFSKHGLVLAGSNNEEVKEQTKSTFIESVQQEDAAFKALSEQSNKLQEQWHQQVTLYDSHLFYLSKNNGRIKISRDEAVWQTGNGKVWSSSELVNEIENDHARFSPDVFLRPIIQDRLLPTLGYVGGPGEIAYYGQMKSFYKIFGMKMPVIFPRLSATFVEPAIVRIFRALPFKIEDYKKRIEDLESDFAKQTEQIDIENLFDEWKKGVDDLQAFHSKTIKNIDETLEGSSKKAQAHYFNELDKLKGKTYRAVKENEETQIKRIHRIQRHLFPNRNLQERTISGIYYMNKFGVDIWERLLENIEDEDFFNKHKLIYL